MRDSIKNSISESVQGLIDTGLPTTFSSKQLKSLGIKISIADITPSKIQDIRHKIGWSQTIFAKVLNVSANAVRQWEQGKREPLGSTKVLIELLEKDPHVLDYRISNS